MWDHMDSPPSISLREVTLEHLLIADTASGEINEGDPAVHRRLHLASLVYNRWTERGTDPAALAARLMDGSVDALEDFVTAADDSLPEGTQQSAGVTEGWQACQDWETADGGVNLQFLSEKFGDARIWATASASTSDGYGGGQRHDMTVAEYVDWWLRHKQGHEEQLLYLKDWHFAYVLPEYFRDDWLNEYYDMRQTSHQAASTGNGTHSQENIVTSDYRFVYLGPKGTTTALHADVLRSFSWSVNVCGRKRWRLLPPQHTHLLYDRFGREMAPDFETDGCRAQHFPNLAAARRHVIEVDQGVGEAIFVPSGWHHTVTNLEDTLSINHNWLNGFNLHRGWALLRREHAEAAAAIEDCRATCSPEEFEELVQRNMAANCGLDFRAAAEFVGCIAARELRLIRQPAISRQQRLMHLFNLQRALPSEILQLHERRWQYGEKLRM
ncbi:Clavaminate synthase-like protein [Coccomyxa subellipsoidea C-169]|uniref:Clavaminate synthase-like protein n=1 Tax=Coccomyxa subellipsoidea (strain C-169) TaxID=574566 RepID=I0YQP5_COCSC|nr:Clavaminate synthase-like protein [Coccomyxa subellipsoidea C-169]EIE20714.1 Clavaminate synthase-like protein [Coccomyxa subellipsoidea C-169]|eukprot:XP_005645258.1 Clavaminate synthase-like protein [Coccomyxa subellipsoidea C-169]